MNVYVYQADLYCEACGEEIRAALDAEGKRPEDPSNEISYDSDEYPKGPYGPAEEGDADHPCYCRECNLFLENDLTEEGKQYVRESIERDLLLSTPRWEGQPLSVWRSFYDIDPKDPRAIRLGRMSRR